MKAGCEIFVAKIGGAWGLSAAALVAVVLEVLCSNFLFLIYKKNPLGEVFGSHNFLIFFSNLYISTPYHR